MNQEDLERRLQVLEGRIHELTVKYATLAMELRELRHEDELRAPRPSLPLAPTKTFGEGVREGQKTALEIGVAVGEVKAAVDAVKRSSSKLPRPTKSKPPPKP